MRFNQNGYMLIIDETDRPDAFLVRDSDDKVFDMGEDFDEFKIELRAMLKGTSHDDA